MKYGKKAAALLLVLAMLLCLSACGSFETKMARSLQKMSQLDSLRADTVLDLDLSMSILGITSTDLNLNALVGVDIQTEPALAKADVELSVLGREMNTLHYVVPGEKAWTVYSSADGGETWADYSVEGQEFDLDVSPRDMLQTLSACAASFEEVGSERINGSMATIYQGEIAAEYVGAAIQAAGLPELMEDMLDVEIDEDVFSQTGSIPVKIFLDEKSGMIVRIGMDLTQMAGGMLEQALASAALSAGLEDLPLDKGLKVKTMNVTMDLSQFNKVEEITLPQSLSGDSAA